MNAFGPRVKYPRKQAHAGRDMIANEQNDYMIVRLEWCEDLARKKKPFSRRLAKGLDRTPHVLNHLHSTALLIID